MFSARLGLLNLFYPILPSKKLAELYTPELDKMSKFQMPDITTKTVALATLRVYKTRLNKLVPFGFNTIQDLQSNQTKLIEAVNTLNPGTTSDPDHQKSSLCKCSQCKTREARRYFYTAIFYALADTPFIKEKNDLYYEFGRNKQNYNSH
jgi:hypothetical protein